MIAPSAPTRRDVLAGKASLDGATGWPNCGATRAGAPNLEVGAAALHEARTVVRTPVANFSTSVSAAAAPAPEQTLPAVVYGAAGRTALHSGAMHRKIDPVLSMTGQRAALVTTTFTSTRTA